VILFRVLCKAATGGLSLRKSHDEGHGFTGPENFQLDTRWVPQDKEDPTMKRIYSGAESGAGAVSDWQGKGNAGKGRMTIVESAAPNKVLVKVDFVRPFVAHNVNEFVLEPNEEPSEPGSSTKVTWTMRGPNLFFMKVMGVFVNMDRMLGKHFEAGLQNLKSVLES